jgi:hypothetical protein
MRQAHPIGGIVEAPLEPLQGKLDALVLKMLVNERFDLMAFHGVLAPTDLAAHW